METPSNFQDFVVSKYHYIGDSNSGEEEPLSEMRFIMGTIDNARQKILRIISIYVSHN